MLQNFKLKDLLEIENDGEMLSFRCPDTAIPLWSLIRGRLHRMILGDYFYGGSLTGGWDADKKQINIKLAATVSKAFIHNAYQIQTLNQGYPVLIMATGARIIKNDGLYFNCLSDYFVAAAQNQTLTTIL